jgi:hypothetical protein
MQHTYKFISVSVDKATSKVSFKDPRCNCFAPLYREATNFENGYHEQRVTLFSIPQRQTHKQLANVQFAHKYTRNYIKVSIFWGRSVSKKQHSQQLQHNFLTDQ